MDMHLSEQQLEELHDLQDGIGRSAEASAMIKSMTKALSTAAGRKALIEDGIFQNAAEIESFSATNRSQVLEYRVLKYLRWKKDYQRFAETQPTMRASSPELRCDRAESLINESGVAKLLSCGYLIVDGALDKKASKCLREEIEFVDENGLLRDDNDICNPGSRSNWLHHSTDEENRELQETIPRLHSASNFLKGVAHALDRLGGDRLHMRVPLRTLVASYPPGAYYRKHLDSYGGSDNPRVVTCLLYANPDWHKEDGGALQLDLDDGPLVVEPLAGRLVIFLSRQIWHQVLPSSATRYALTMWLWSCNEASNCPHVEPPQTTQPADCASIGAIGNLEDLD